jgi:hypothetical protein
MRNRTLLLGWLFTGAILAFTSCKKDDAATSPNQASGTFSTFEAEINGQVVTLPTADDKMEIKIAVADGEHANVTITYYNQGQQQSTPSIACNIGKDPDGFLVLTEASTGNMLVMYYDQETIDCFPSPGDRLSASRNGKKPDWWDD